MRAKFGVEPELIPDLLALVGPDADASTWTCDEVECAGPAADDLRRAAAAGPISGTQLAKLAAGITRTQDGLFEATRPGEDRPWLALRAVAGSNFIVATRGRDLLDRFRRRFQDEVR